MCRRLGFVFVEFVVDLVVWCCFGLAGESLGLVVLGVLVMLCLW